MVFVSIIFGHFEIPDSLKHPGVRAPFVAARGGEFEISNALWQNPSGNQLTRMIMTIPTGTRVNIIFHTDKIKRENLNFFTIFVKIFRTDDIGCHIVMINDLVTD